MIEGDYKLNDVEFVQQAIDKAKAFAEAKGVPLTVERLCVCLNVGRNYLVRYIDNDDLKSNNALSSVQNEIKSILKTAMLECGADLVEDGLRARNPAQHIFLEKVHLGYRETQDINMRSVVVFEGEQDIPD